jgi:hypothetical protein
MVISPGSRNAPLAIHFSDLDSFECFSVVDERSAAFTAMGMAKSLKSPLPFLVLLVLRCQLLSCSYRSFLSKRSAFNFNSRQTEIL